MGKERVGTIEGERFEKGANTHILFQNGEP